MMSRLLSFSIAWLLFSVPLQARDLVFEHATLVNLDRFGTSRRDIPDASADSPSYLIHRAS